MKRKIIAGGLLILAAVFSTNLGLAQQEKASAPGGIASPSAAEKGLRAASDQFYAALNAMFTGDLAPMNAIWSHGDDVTDMGPFGGRLTGWKEVGAEFAKEAGMKLGGRVACSDVIVRVGGDMGYTVCVEQGENMSADGKPVAVRFRATNVFRLINGEWKMVHHHTDISSQLEAATGIAK
ncbi:MAG: nuclear transport factor 2 family protein [Verrucomicrobia bacterium]|nr:nuclear transport factor 2 family protein [Verrucomicrobiota bacterium]